MLKSLIKSTAIVGALIAAASAAQAQHYSFKYFQDPSPNAYVTEGKDLNSTGELVGWYTNYYNGIWGFTESNGAFKTVTIPTSGSPDTGINAVSDTGQLLGYGPSYGFLLDSSGNLTTIKVPSSWKATSVAMPVGINASKTIVGNVSTANGSSEGFVLQNGTYKSYQVPGSYSTTLGDINDSGVLVGSYLTISGGSSTGFVLINGTLSKVQFPGAISTVATSINEAGHVVGYYYDANRNLLPFFFDGTTYTQISVPGEYACTISHIKNSGDIVGTCTSSTTFLTTAFVGTPAS